MKKILLHLLIAFTLLTNTVQPAHAASNMKTCHTGFFALFIAGFCAGKAATTSDNSHHEHEVKIYSVLALLSGCFGVYKIYRGMQGP
jgi:hypothetical protein